ncbi:MAG: SMP-30/gluconolactonase/LRE family protein [Candidatus Cloacimonetes bacterium]|nr:SMP-30/gluconolactonase/LRE family protein [Candidatus Cloacimonadota bacterium]
MKTMKIIIVLLFMVVYSTGLYCQYLNNPESVVYDSLNSRYLVSNWGSGNIVQIDSTGTQSIWLSNAQCFAGLHIRDSVIYTACREYGVKGFNLNTGENVLDIDISGATNINDITSDNSGNLYVSYPTGDAIYKINIATEQSWLFADSGLDVPNGLYFDEPNNRLLVVSYRTNSPIQEISLIDSIASVVTYTGKHNLDGLTRDAEGNYYFSSWQSNRVYRINSTFSNSPEVFSTHNDDPADIYFDIENNLLVVPLFFTHQIEFVSGTIVGSFMDQIEESDELKNVYNYPNPFNPSTTISFDVAQTSSFVTLGIYNIKSQKVKTLVNDVLPVREYSIIWDGRDSDGNQVSSGIYFYKLKAGNFEKTKKMILLK